VSIDDYVQGPDHKASNNFDKNEKKTFNSRDVEERREGKL
jgi:hypothetical protein